jgi:hypothetical protein
LKDHSCTFIRYLVLVLEQIYEFTLGSIPDVSGFFSELSDKDYWVKLLIDFTNTIYTIYMASDWTIVMSNFVSFMSRYIPSECFEMCVNYFKRIFSSEDPDSQSDSEPILVFSLENLKLFLCGQFDWLNDRTFVLVYKFVIECGLWFGKFKNATKNHNKTVDDIFARWSRVQPLVYSGKDLIVTIFDAFQFVVSHFDEISSGKWSCFLTGRDDTKTWFGQLSELKEMSKLIELGLFDTLLDQYGLSVEGYRAKLLACISKGKDMIESTANLQEQSLLNNAMDALRSMKTVLDVSRSKANLKMQAFAFALTGESGNGKSSILVPMLIEQAARLYGFSSTEEGIIANLNIADKFEDQVTPGSRIYIWMI